MNKAVGRVATDAAFYRAVGIVAKDGTHPEYYFGARHTPSLRHFFFCVWR